jgi:hypothetical protein
MHEKAKVHAPSGVHATLGRPHLPALPSPLHCRLQPPPMPLAALLLLRLFSLLYIQGEHFTSVKTVVTTCKSVWFYAMLGSSDGAKKPIFFPTASHVHDL